MAKTKRYHINADNVVAECTATFKPCPFRDYDTIQGAETALALRNERSQLEAAREQVDAVLKNPNTPKTFGIIKYNGNLNSGKTPRDYANMMDEVFLQYGEDPAIQRAQIPLLQTNVGEVPRVRVSAFRRPRADYDRGVIGGIWELEMTYNSGVFPKETLEIDLNGDRENALAQARNFLRETVIINSTSLYDDQVEKQTDYLLSQLKAGHVVVEEEAQGPYQVFEEFGWKEGKGSFRASDSVTVRVSEEWNSTTFRAHSLERFIKDNPFYLNQMPEMELRVLDNSQGKSKDWWAVRYTNGEWRMDFLNAEYPEGVSYQVHSPEEGVAKLREFLNENMLEKLGYEKVKEKRDNARLVWLEDYMVQVEGVVARAERRFQQQRDKERELEEAHMAKMRHKSLFAHTSNKNSTMGTILDMFS